MLAAQRCDPPDPAQGSDRAPGRPTVVRITLGTHLRRLRESRGISREAAGEAIRASHAKISRVELGRVGVKARDLLDLLTLYGVSDEAERAELLALARHGNEPGWWRRYGEVLFPWFEPYLGLEQASSVIRTYEVQFVPGLLQTEAIAREVIRLYPLQECAEHVEGRVALRMARQDILTHPGAPDYGAVVDEAALRRLPGTRQAQRTQLRHLLEMAELPNVTLQVLPFRAGGHPAAGGPFTLLQFTEPDMPDIVYLEQLTSAVYLDKKRDTSNYRAVMERLCQRAASPAETTTLLQEIINQT